MAGRSLSALAKDWYITSALPCCRMTNASLSPSGTSTVLIKPKCCVQNGSTGSIFSTKRMGVIFFTGIRFSLRDLLVLIRLVEEKRACQGDCHEKRRPPTKGPDLHRPGDA